MALLYTEELGRFAQRSKKVDQMPETMDDEGPWVQGVSRGENEMKRKGKADPLSRHEKVVTNTHRFQAGAVQEDHTDHRGT